MIKSSARASRRVVLPNTMDERRRQAAGSLHAQAPHYDHGQDGNKRGLMFCSIQRGHCTQPQHCQWPAAASCCVSVLGKSTQGWVGVRGVRPTRLCERVVSR